MARARFGALTATAAFLIFSSEAWAQAAGGAANSAAGAPGGIMGGPFGQLLIFVPIIILFYFLIIRPQQRRAKDHQTMLGGLKRGDTVVLSSGMIGKVTRIEDQEAMVEISTGVNVRVVKAMITEVRTRGEPAKVAAPKPDKS
jgi:preprotein translocase subunit YajC